MYVNYGDKNFWEYGVLVDAERAIPESVKIIRCVPFPEPDSDGNTVYLFAECEVDTTDSWINADVVKQSAGLHGAEWDATDETEKLIRFAIACIECYGEENFASPYDGFVHDKTYIRDVLKYRMIAYDDLQI